MNMTDMAVFVYFSLSFHFCDLLACEQSICFNFHMSMIEFLIFWLGFNTLSMFILSSFFLSRCSQLRVFRLIMLFFSLARCLHFFCMNNFYMAYISLLYDNDTIHFCFACFSMPNSIKYTRCIPFIKCEKTHFLT